MLIRLFYINVYVNVVLHFVRINSMDNNNIMDNSVHVIIIVYQATRSYSNIKLKLCTIAVSYTHLDVYKRQTIDIIIKISVTDFKFVL